MLELSPLNSTTVPPDKTGLAPREASPTLVPLEIVETIDPPDDESGVLPELQTLHAVMSRFQMPFEIVPVLFSVVMMPIFRIE